MPIDALAVLLIENTVTVPLMAAVVRSSSCGFPSSSFVTFLPPERAPTFVVTSRCGRYLAIRMIGRATPLMNPSGAVALSLTQARYALAASETCWAICSGSLVSMFGDGGADQIGRLSSCVNRSSSVSWLGITASARTVSWSATLTMAPSPIRAVAPLW